MQVIKEWGALAGSVMAIITLLLFVARPLYKMFKQHSACSADMKARLERLERHTTDNYKAGLRMAVWSDDLPLTERVDAGEKYISLKGNGATMVRHQQNVKALEKEVAG